MNPPRLGTGFACLAADLDAPVPGPVYLLGDCASSLDIARLLPLPILGSLLALSQRQGRGQLGRNWVSPPGNLYATLRLPLNPPFDSCAAAPAFGGVVARALAELGFAVRVKWPNDLVLADPHDGRWRKVGGILLEEREGRLHAGLGLNLISAPSDSAMRADRACAAGSLGLPPSGITAFWLDLVRGMARAIVRMDSGNWRAETEPLLAFAGCRVRVVDGDSPDIRGRLTGLDPSGGLCLEQHGTRTICHSGSLIPEEDR